MSQRLVTIGSGIASVHYERGMDSIEHVHGHNGKTRIVFLDDPE